MQPGNATVTSRALAKGDLPWLLVGAAILFAITAALVLFRRDDRDVRGFVSKAGRVDLVSGMRAALAAASEAEKTAMLATNDEDSRTYVDQSRAATAETERKRGELAGLIQEKGTPAGKSAL